MKKCLKLLSLFFLCFLLNGCYYYHNSGEVLDDHSLHIKLIFAQYAGEEDDYYHSVSDSIAQYFIDKGFSHYVEEEKEINEHGYSNSYNILEKTIPNIKNLCSDEKNVISNIGFFSDEEAVNFSDPVFYCEAGDFNKTIYNANFYFKLRFLFDVGEESQWLDPADYEPGQSVYDLAINYSDLVYCFNVGDGEFISSEDADISNDGKIACWTLDPINENYFQFSFSLNDGAIVDFDENELTLLTDSADTGEIVQFRVVNPSMVEKIIIKDKNGNIIPYNVINKDRGEYAFSLPEEDVSIQVQYRKNPSTFNNKITIIGLILVMISVLFSLLYMYNKSKEIDMNV